MAIRHAITEIILRALQKSAEGTIDLLDMHFSDYYTAYRKARRGMLGDDENRFRFSKDWAQLYKERQSFYSTLSRLKKQGLISQDKNLRWKIAKSGSEKLKEIKNKQALIIPKIPAARPVIVSYDIPEHFRLERNKVRKMLRILDFKMIQRSVWLGPNKIPEIYLKWFKEKKILNDLHIFEVGEKGTLEKIS